MSKHQKIFGGRAKPLAAAIALGIGAAALGPQALAVNVSQNGLGEVLLFPYYTVRNDLDTLISVTNTSENTVVFKIRFREAHNSRDARDFNVVLSPYDVWTAVITEAETAPGSGVTVARLQTGDTSCTVPRLPIDVGGGVRGVNFASGAYDGSTPGFPLDSGPVTLDRTKEGYIEIIQMGHQKPLISGLPSPQLTFRPGSVGHNAKHVNNVPRDCAAVVQALGVNVAAAKGDFDEPINVLQGAATIIKVTEGKAMSYDPVVLANFFNPELVDGVSDQDLLFTPDSENPQLNQADPAIAELIGSTIDSPVSVQFVESRDAVSAVLSHAAVINSFTVNPVVKAATDWVLTFPTKYYYVDEKYGMSRALPPFDASDLFKAPPLDCSAVEVNFRYFNREEAELVSGIDPGFSPPTPGVPPTAICHESQVITFNNSDVLGSANSKHVTLDPAYINGWMRLSFPMAGDLVGTGADGNEVVFTGLPVIGFAATTLENGVNGNAVLNYGMSWSHAYETDIATSAD